MNNIKKTALINDLNLDLARKKLDQTRKRNKKYQGANYIFELLIRN